MAKRAGRWCTTTSGKHTRKRATCRTLRDDQGKDHGQREWKSGEIKTEHYAQVGTDIVNASGELNKNTTISEGMDDLPTMLRQTTL